MDSNGDLCSHAVADIEDELKINIGRPNRIQLIASENEPLFAPKALYLSARGLSHCLKWADRIIEN